MRLKLCERTFGLELEFADIAKDNIELLDGYSWSMNEKSIVNTNAKKATPAGSVGGELNTRPLHFNRNDLRELRGVIKECFNNGGVVMWNTGFDGHIYIGDLELEELKKILALYFYVSPYLFDVFDIGEWFDVPFLVPRLRLDVYENAMKAENIEKFKNAFANSSIKGHWRFAINIMPYFKTGTLEFRIFNGTKNFRETLETIKFMYKFLDVALNNNIEYFKKIDNINDFIRIFDIRLDRIPKKTYPLLFANDKNVFTTNISKAFPLNKNLLSCVTKITDDDICIVNTFRYTDVVSLYKKKNVTLYNNDEYNEVVRRIALGELRITYKGDYEILNGYKNNTEEELIIFLIFSKIYKIKLKYLNGTREFLAYIENIDQSIEKLRETANKLIDMFQNIKYVKGTLIDALENREKNILYLQEYNSKNSSIVKMLKKHTDYKSDFKRKEYSYKNVYKLAENVNRFMAVSISEYLPMHKVCKDGKIYLYSNKENDYCGVDIKIKDEVYNFKIPDDDFKITEETKIDIVPINQNFMTYLNRRFIKKIAKGDKRIRTPYNFAVYADGYIIGAFGFKIEMQNEEIGLFTDFVTNNNICRLSKFLLLLIKTKKVKRYLEMKLMRKVETADTHVYTTYPVSLKYRGIFKKVGREGRHLVYRMKFGDIKDVAEAKKEYFKRIENCKKDGK